MRGHFFFLLLPLYLGQCVSIPTCINFCGVYELTAKLIGPLCLWITWQIGERCIFCYDLPWCIDFRTEPNRPTPPWDPISTWFCIYLIPKKLKDMPLYCFWPCEYITSPLPFALHSTQQYLPRLIKSKSPFFASSKLSIIYPENKHDQSQETHQDGKGVAEGSCHQEEENFSSKNPSGFGCWLL